MNSAAFEWNANELFVVVVIFCIRFGDVMIGSLLDFSKQFLESPRV